VLGGCFVFRAIASINLLSFAVTRHAVRDDDPPPDRRRSLLAALEAEVVGCRRCPRLVDWREQVAVEKRAAFRDETYWGRPIPGFGDPDARIVVLGLAPAAHGANRTGRVFTGDRSGDWLFRAMHRAGLANQSTSVSADDGLRLTNAWVTAAVKCAPPQNKPLPAERDACAPFLERELAALDQVRVVVCLGGFGYDAACRHFDVRPRPRFGHAVEVDLVGLPGRDVRKGERPAPVLLCSYHPSQQNTFTGRLTEEMLDAVFARAVELGSDG
jgi:uracil-DNA glycosylase family 4